ncbi:MAG TPA: sugar ABC transporter permease [Symbiobacteriaceae bacterium]|nr:sugar ABC transporter permease [Symbiobacteriaceae bacterium]
MRAQSLGRKLMPYAYLSPALISIAVLSVAPMIYTIYLAFTDTSLYTFKSGAQFIGFQNFVEIFQGSFSKVFFPVFGWTISYSALATLTQYAAGMFVAVLLNNPNLKETRLYRSLLIIPWAIPGSIATLAWTGLFNTSNGSINLWLGKLFAIDPIPWLQDPNLARVAVLIVNLWLGFPFMMTVSLGALQAIPHDLYEAADIDGANVWRKFWDVTFPLMLRFSLPLVIGTFAYNFNSFNTAFLMVNGGPARVGPFNAGYTDILASVGYKLTVTLNRYGLSAALSIILFFLVAGVTLLNMKATGAFKEEES